MTDEFGEVAVFEPFEQQSTRITMNGRGDLPGARDVEFANFQLTDHVPRSGLPRRLSRDATMIRWHGTSRWWPAIPPRSRCALAPSTIRRTATTGRWRTSGRDRPGR